MERKKNRLYISSSFFLNLGKDPAASQFPSVEGNAVYQTGNRKKVYHCITLDQISFIKAFPLLLHINRLRVDRVNERPSAWSTSLGPSGFGIAADSQQPRQDPFPSAISQKHPSLL